VTSLFPSSLTVSFAWAATVAETLSGTLLIAGVKIQMASVLSGLLLLSLAIGLTVCHRHGLLSPLESLCRYSVNMPTQRASRRHCSRCTSTYPADKTQSDVNRSRAFHTGPSFAKCRSEMKPKRHLRPLDQSFWLRNARDLMSSGIRKRYLILILMLIILAGFEVKSQNKSTFNGFDLVDRRGLAYGSYRAATWLLTGKN